MTGVPGVGTLPPARAIALPLTSVGANALIHAAGFTAWLCVATSRMVLSSRTSTYRTDDRLRPPTATLPFASCWAARGGCGGGGRGRVCPPGVGWRGGGAPPPPGAPRAAGGELAPPPGTAALRRLSVPPVGAGGGAAADPPMPMRPPETPC